jgi:hypothetical protein
MKGVVFNLLEEFIIANSDEDTYEEILDECTFVTDGPFVGPGTYPDEYLIMLVGKDVAPPLFEFGDPAPDKLVIRHQSKRQMYDLMDGLIDGVADHFECPIEFTRQVQGDGSEAFFVYELTFDRAA